MAGISENIKGAAWITPLVIGFVIAVAIIATAALVYVRRSALVNTIHSRSGQDAKQARLPINLTPIFFGGKK